MTLPKSPPNPLRTRQWGLVLPEKVPAAEASLGCIISRCRHRVSIRGPEGLIARSTATRFGELELKSISEVVKL